MNKEISGYFTQCAAMRCPDGAVAESGFGRQPYSGSCAMCRKRLSPQNFLHFTRPKSQSCALWRNGASVARDISPQRIGII